MVAIDIMGPFPLSSKGIIICDYFTRWVEAFGIPNQAATTVADKLMEFILRFGVPEQLHSDQGRNFESDVIAEVCNTLGVVKTRTTPYHPQSDGLVERQNRTLLSMLAMVTANHPSSWENHLQGLCMAYNTSVQPTTGYTPFFLMFGRQARIPIDIAYGTPTPSALPTTKYAAALNKRLETAYHQVRTNSGNKLDYEKELYDKRIHGKEFSLGDKVWLHCPTVPRGQSKKLHKPWKGPFSIVKKLSDVTYVIRNLQNRRQKFVVHFNRLKYYPDTMREDPKAKTRPHQSAQKPKETYHLGTNLQIIDQDSDTELNFQNENGGPPTNGAPTSRYPSRTRRRPDYYHDSI